MWLLYILSHNNGCKSAAITPCALLGRPFHKILETGCRDSLYLSPKSISEVEHRCWVIRPGLQSVLQFIPKAFNGVDVRALCRPVKFFHTEPGNPQSSDRLGKKCSSLIHMNGASPAAQRGCHLRELRQNKSGAASKIVEPGSTFPGIQRHLARRGAGQSHSRKCTFLNRLLYNSSGIFLRFTSW